MQEALRAARVARGCTAFGDRSWVGGGARERRGRPLGVGLKPLCCQAGMPGTVSLGVKVRVHLGPCRGPEVSEKGRRSQASGRRVPSGRFSLGTC